MGLPIELTYKKWLARINENLTFVLLNIKEKREITEKDYELLTTLHRIWFLGEFPVYAHENPHIVSDEKAVDQGLFDKNDIQVVGGTEVESGAEDKT